MLSDVTSILSSFIYMYMSSMTFGNIISYIENNCSKSMKTIDRYTHLLRHPIWNKVLTNEIGTKHC